MSTPGSLTLALDSANLQNLGFFILYFRCSNSTASQSSRGEQSTLDPEVRSISCPDTPLLLSGLSRCGPLVLAFDFLSLELLSSSKAFAKIDSLPSVLACRGSRLLALDFALLGSVLFVRSFAQVDLPSSPMSVTSLESALSLQSSSKLGLTLLAFGGSRLGISPLISDVAKLDALLLLQRLG